ncbi:DNA-binding protein [Streptomyces sp. NPDC086023]|uniref:DNA-binding protein n=1 Tax=Streptomyces sp. NPDC086023 TaxID=3365746 RepID=UPI0037D3C27E
MTESDRSPAGICRVGPLSGETTWSLMCRLAARYGQEPGFLLGHWRWKNHQPRHPGGALRADAEVLLSPVGRAVLAGLSRVDEENLSHALPSWDSNEDGLTAQESADDPQALWRVGGAVIGPVAFGCRLCTAQRTGQPVRAVRYAERWERVCRRHGRWLLDADADQPLENLDLRRVPEVVGAQRRWGGVARRAWRAGVAPAEVFGLARAVVCRWWEHSLHWEQEQTWPRRLEQVAGRGVRGDADRWRAIGRDAVVFPEIVALANVLLDPAAEELAWTDSGRAGLPRPLPGESRFERHLGEQVGRPWLGPLVATDGGPLITWKAAVIRWRWHTRVDPYDAGPWRVRADQQPPTMAALLVSRPGRRPRAVPVRTGAPSCHPNNACASPASSRPPGKNCSSCAARTRAGRTADAARLLLQRLSHSIELLDQALRETALAAVTAGVALHDVEQWAGIADSLPQDEGGQ